MRSEFKLDEDDDSTKRNKVKYFAVQINSPMEENKKQIVEHYQIPNIVNIKGDSSYTKKSDKLSNEIDDFDDALNG